MSAGDTRIVDVVFEGRGAGTSGARRWGPAAVVVAIGAHLLLYAIARKTEPSLES
ncbi:MAG: hypothetical protein JNK82_34475, partial [Myxococcaceae bacterium]|nr:hypothetical protein [Myxococcaceae bacterium]